MSCLHIKLPLLRWATGVASLAMLVSSVLLVPSADADEEIAPVFTVVSAQSHIEDEVVRLDAVFDLGFSEKLVEALHKGVSLTLLIEIEVLRERNYWVSESIAEIEQRFQLSFNPLTGRYLYYNINSDARFQLPSFDAAKAVLSHLNNFPLLDDALLEKEKRYWARMRIKMDSDTFPVPLRLMTYVTSDLDLESEWYEWPLLP